MGSSSYYHLTVTIDWTSYNDSGKDCLKKYSASHIKRKPVLSVRYLHCHARFYQTSMRSLSSAFSLLSFDTKHMMISQCMNDKEQFKLMHVKIDLRRIMVLSWYYQSQTIPNPCRNKESKQKKLDKRDKRNANECLFNTSLCSETWQTPLSP